MAQLLSMREAAERLGLDRPHAAQWLRRHLLQRERDTGRAILIRRGVRYYISLTSLRRACPELVDPADQIGRALRESVRDRRRHDRTVIERLDEMDAKISLLTEIARKIWTRLGPTR